MVEGGEEGLLDDRTGEEMRVVWGEGDGGEGEGEEVGHALESGLWVGGWVG